MAENKIEKRIKELTEEHNKVMSSIREYQNILQQLGLRKIEIEAVLSELMEFNKEKADEDGTSED